MSERKEAQIKMGWINPFTVIGSLLGWIHTHTWQGVAWGFGLGVVAPIGVIFFVVAMYVLGTGVANLSARRTSPRYRVEMPGEKVVDPWEQAYAEHCEANNLPNELRA